MRENMITQINKIRHEKRKSKGSLVDVLKTFVLGGWKLKETVQYLYL